MVRAPGVYTRKIGDLCNIFKGFLWVRQGELINVFYNENNPGKSLESDLNSDENYTNRNPAVFWSHWSHEKKKE